MSGPEPSRAEVSNAVVEALAGFYEWLPFDVFYGAADLAIEAVEYHREKIRSIPPGGQT